MPSGRIKRVHGGMEEKRARNSYNSQCLAAHRIFEPPDSHEKASTVGGVRPAGFGEQRDHMGRLGTLESLPRGCSRG